MSGGARVALKGLKGRNIRTQRADARTCWPKAYLNVAYG